MKRILLSVSLLCLFSASVFSQSFQNSFFSPITGYFSPLPYSEVAFISPRVHSLGFNLYNVIPDTLTQLFLNPAQITSISRPTFYLNFEPSSQLEDAHSEFFAPSIHQSEYGVNLPFLLNSGLKFYPFSNSNYFSIGIWNSIFSHPVGFFLRFSSYLGNDNTNGLANNNSLTRQLYRKYYFAQIWLSLLQRENVKIGLSYGLSNQREQNDSQNRNKSNQIDSHFYRYVAYGRDRYSKWHSYQKHTVQLGAYIKHRQWLLKPRIGILLFQNNNSYYFDSSWFSNQKDLSDSEHVYLKSTLSSYEDYYKKDPVAGGDMSLDLERGNTVIFLYGFLGKNVPEEYYHFKHKENSIDRIHSQHNQTKEETTYMDVTTAKNTSWYSQFRMGVGNRFYFRDHVAGYISLFGERAGFHEVVPFSGGRTEYTATVDDTNLTQQTFNSKSDIRLTFYRLGLPIGIEMQRGIFSFRMGIEEDYTWQNDRIVLLGTRGGDPYSNSTTWKHLSREYYFGVGMREGNLTLNIKFDSQLIQYRLWNIAFTYHW